MQKQNWGQEGDIQKLARQRTQKKQMVETFNCPLVRRKIAEKDKQCINWFTIWSTKASPKVSAESRQSDSHMYMVLHGFVCLCSNYVCLLPSCAFHQHVNICAALLETNKWSVDKTCYVWLSPHFQAMPSLQCKHFQLTKQQSKIQFSATVSYSEKQEHITTDS